MQREVIIKNSHLFSAVPVVEECVKEADADDLVYICCGVGARDL